MAKWVCSVCGYVYEGENPPESCPQCKVPADKFIKQDTQEMTWAAEHVVGVAKGVDPEIVEGLRANFEGECSEVGMYLAMARVAHREGYPEIGLYWLSTPPSSPSFWAKWSPTAPRRIWRCAWRPRTAPPPARPLWPRRPRSWVWMPSTTPSTRWPVTRPAMERL